MFFINFISLYLLAAAVAVIFCVVQIRTLNSSRYTQTAIMLGLAVCVYILGYTMELNSFVPANIFFWNQIEYLGIPFVSALWLTTGLQYTGSFASHKKILFPAIFGIPLITLFLRLTNSWHFWYFASMHFDHRFGILLFVKQPGVWMYVQFVHSTLMILIAMGILIYDSAKSTEQQTGKILLIISASMLSVAGLVLVMFKPFGIPIDYMALFLPLTCIMVILTILRYDLLETKSIARSKAFEADKDAILLINRQNIVLDYNSSAKRLIEQMNIVLNNRSLKDLFAEIPNFLTALQKTEPTIVKLRINDYNRYYEITTENIDKRNCHRGWIKTIRDITERYQLAIELKKQATTDELSVLANRRAFINLGKEWVSRSEKNGSTLYLLMLDLDYFKGVNDQYGHPTGDFVIREFSQLLKNHFPTKSLVARIGGEEFVVLLEGLSDAELLQSQTAFLTKIEQHTYCYLGNKFHVTASIGITKKQPGQTLENMLGKADKALYQSKNQGRNCATVQ